MHVLIVEDDAVHAAAAKNALQPLDHDIVTVQDGETAMRYLKSRTVDIVILDWKLPNMSGFEVLHWVRKARRELAVLFLSSRASEIDIVLALEAGADDYIVKPFRMAELVARFNALLRRTRHRADLNEVVRAGEYTLNPVTRTVSLRGKPIELTAKEFDLIAFFFSNIGKLLSRDAVAGATWGRELSVASRTIDTHIYRIRQKLSLVPENGLRLSSIYTHGYRLDDVSDKALQPVQCE